MKQKSLEGKVALVTGASRGIGRAIAKKLAGDGVHVVAIARKIADLEELDDEITKEYNNAKITLVPMDIRDYKAIDLLGEKIYQKWKSLDILISNAAILGMLAPVSHIKPSVFADTMEINLIANYRLIYTFDALLNKAKNGAHAIFLSSSASSENRPYWAAYATSKAALETLVMTYANENIKKNICVQLFIPGAVKTRMYQKAYPGRNLDKITKPQQIAEAVADILKKHHDKTACLFDYVTKQFIYKNG